MLPVQPARPTKLCDSEQVAGLDDRREWMLANLPLLRGKPLACWCPVGADCHGDVLVELANRPRGK